MMKNKARENRLRRMAQRQGLMLRRSRTRDPFATSYGRYSMAWAHSNTHAFGAEDGRPAATLDEIEAFLRRPR